MYVHMCTEIQYRFQSLWVLVVPVDQYLRVHQVNRLVLQHHQNQLLLVLPTIQHNVCNKQVNTYTCKCIVYILYNIS